MRTKVQKWGNSLAVRIPRPFAEELGVDRGAEVEIFLQDERLVLQPVTRCRFTLAELLAQVHDDNLQDEVLVEGPVGGEVW